MAKSLVARSDTKAYEKRWSAEVKREYGWQCWFHRRKDPRTKTAGTEAAHIIARSVLGWGAKIWLDGKKIPLAFASVRFGRPLCHDCHQRQGLGLDPEYFFSLEDRVDAVLAHNELPTTVKLPVPLE